MNKKLFLSLLTLIMVVIASVNFTACSSDDENDNFSELQSSFQKTKNNIVGTWILEARYNPSTSNPYIKLGWDNSDELGLFKHNPFYKFVFKNNGTFTDKDDGTFNFSIEFDKDRDAYYTKEHYSEYWPFSNGVIVLKFDEKYLMRSVLVEIRKDGMLYFYDSTLGNSGLPLYRYKKQ